jgi:F-type H+-transporting ATPase subunit gamma
MAKARAIVKRRKSVQNIKKITRTMELIATARFKKALDRAVEAEAYTRKIAEIVADLGQTSGDVSHPLLEAHDPVNRSLLLVLTSNRGLAGGYNGNVLRVAMRRLQEADAEGVPTTLEVAGKRGLAFFRFRRIRPEKSFTHFEDRPQFAEVDAIADRYIHLYTSGQIDRLEVIYTRFLSSARQEPTLTTLLPMSAAQVGELGPSVSQKKPGAAGPGAEAPGRAGERVPYEFLPDARSILEEIVPVSFKVRLFKCFLDAAVSEQIARMVAMKGATENADGMIKSLTRQYNRARQSQITRELAEIIGGAAALE